MKLPAEPLLVAPALSKAEGMNVDKYRWDNNSRTKHNILLFL
jgi:hypothetical protein